MQFIHVGSRDRTIQPRLALEISQISFIQVVEQRIDVEGKNNLGLLQRRKNLLQRGKRNLVVSILI